MLQGNKRFSRHYHQQRDRASQWRAKYDMALTELGLASMSSWAARTVLRADLFSR